MPIIGQTFEQLVNKTDEEALTEETVLARRQLQRKIASAHDDAVTSRLKAERAVAAMFADFRNKPVNTVDKFDINLLLERLSDADQFARAQARCAELYQELFGEEIPGLP